MRQQHKFRPVLFGFDGIKAKLDDISFVEFFTNAFKMFSADVKNKIKLESTTGFTYALELTAKSYLLKLKIVEIPSVWIEVKNRKSNFKIYII